MGYAETLASATQVLAKGNNVRKVSGSALIAGDIHGDIDSLEKIIALREALDMKHLILLGDYVDRGEKQVEVVERIAELIQSDDDFVPLRGNHEDAAVCARYGFVEQLEIHDLSNEISFDFFAELPMVAVSSAVYMAHGGIPVENNFKVSRIEQRSEFPREHTLKTGPQYEIGWNDPLYDGREKNHEYVASSRGGHSKEWGIAVTDNFLDTNNLELIIRAHIAFKAGFKWMHDNKVLSLFSSSSGPYDGFTRSVVSMELSKPETVTFHEI